VTRPVHFRPQASIEAFEARSWYESRRAALGAEFAVALDALVERITENPEAFPLAREDTRRAALRRFPYAICFRLRGDDVIVLAVHGRQDPQRWQSRS
jgi:plasmid stabilization system protein ParE